MIEVLQNLQVLELPASGTVIVIQNGLLLLIAAWLGMNLRGRLIARKAASDQTV